MKVAILLLSMAGLCAMASSAKSCKRQFRAPKGVFTSPGFPNRYGRNLRCYYRFNTGWPVTLDCKAFQVLGRKRGRKCRGDSLTIKDSRTMTAFCGKTRPRRFTTSTSDVTAIFRSNGKKEGKGFRCRYTSVMDNTTPPTTTPPATTPPATTTNTKTTTSATSSLLSKALERYRSNTCYTDFRRICGCSVTYKDSQYHTAEVDDKRIIVANGIPNHVYEVEQENPNPNKACPHEVYMAVPLNPVKGSTYTAHRLGPIGVAVSGAFFYNHLSDNQGTVALYQEGDSFDSCHGHSDRTCRYHYHMTPICINGYDTCSLLGYMLDGFPVFANCTSETTGRVLTSCYRLNAGEDGDNSDEYTYSQADYASGACDLDQANGYTFPSGNYGYIFTVDYPFIMTGYYGINPGTLCYIDQA